MKKFDGHGMYGWIDKARFAGIGMLVIAAVVGPAGWYALANASVPAPAARSDGTQPILIFPELPYALPALPQTDITHSAQIKIDARDAALQWRKAKKEVDRRQRKLDKARMDYLRIRRELTKAGLSDDYVELARQRVEDAADALQEAKLIQEQSLIIYMATQETARGHANLKTAAN